MRGETIVECFAFVICVNVFGCGGELAEEVAIEEAESEALYDNGIKLNGTSLNGIKLNGTSLNGIKLNGTSLNGIKLNGTSLSGTKSDGTSISGFGFVGTILTGTRDDGASVTLRIANIQRDSADAEILLYSVEWKDGARWLPICRDARRNVLPAIPVLGRWRDDGSKDYTAGYFTFACRNIGAIAKCVDMKFKPWKSCASFAGTRAGKCQSETLDPYHQACVRMVRADYCGDGVANTEDGNVINVVDPFLVNNDDRRDYTRYRWWFEAFWGPSGAICVSKDVLVGGTYTYRKVPSCASTLPKCENDSTTSTIHYVSPGPWSVKNYGAF